MTRTFLTTAFLTFALTTAASAQPAPPAPAAGTTQVAAPKAPAAEEKKICKKLPASGTRMEKRACLTKAQWDQIDRDED